MNLKQEKASLAHGQALLTLIAERFYVALKTLQLDVDSDFGFFCKFTGDGDEHRSRAGATIEEAIRKGVADIQIYVLEKMINYQSGDEPTAPGAARSLLLEGKSDDRFRSKVRQVTVGVTMPTCLKEHMTGLAASEKISFSEISRGLAVYGFRDFEERSYSVSSKKLLNLLASELAQWQKSDSEQVMLRLEPSYAIRFRAAAKEYRRSASEFSALCMAHGIEVQQQLAVLEVRVSECKGPAVRSLLPKVGLESYAAPLLAGILRGSIKSPKRVQRELAKFFETTETMMSELFSRSFSSKMIPAFKATDGKPTIAARATSWENAVESLGLSEDQTKALLAIK